MTYLLVAYGIMWLIIFIYILSIDLRNIRLHKELARIWVFLKKSQKTN